MAEGVFLCSQLYKLMIKLRFLIMLKTETIVFVTIIDAAIVFVKKI